MWCTTFAFQPWHSAVEFRRYLARFAHMVAGFDRLEGIMRTVYNQFDSLVRPLRTWLNERGVRFELNTRVTDLGLSEQPGKTIVQRIIYERDGTTGEIVVGPGDYVLVTLGSMTEASSPGQHGHRSDAGRQGGRGAPGRCGDKLSRSRPEFGVSRRPSRTISTSPNGYRFTTTLHNPSFLRIVRDLTGNVPGEGGLITFPDSGWLASIVIPHQPHFLGQPDDVSVFWGYGLSVDQPGNFVKKPMSACTGREIMTEMLGHLKIEGEASEILGHMHLHSMHDAIHHQPIPAAPQGGPSAGHPKGIAKPGLYGSILRIARRCRVHRRILGPLGPEPLFMGCSA